MIPAAVTNLPMVAEPEAAMGIEHQVVRPFQPLALEAVIQRRHVPRRQIDALDAAASLLVRSVAGEQKPAGFVPLETAVVAHIGGAVGTDRQPVRATAQFGHHRKRAVRRNARQRSAGDFDQQHRSVGQRHRAFGKAKAGRDHFGGAVTAHSLGRGALRKSAALKPSGAAISTMGSSRLSYSIRSARVITACMS